MGVRLLWNGPSQSPAYRTPRFDQTDTSLRPSQTVLQSVTRQTPQDPHRNLHASISTPRPLSDQAPSAASSPLGAPLDKRNDPHPTGTRPAPRTQLSRWIRRLGCDSRDQTRKRLAFVERTDQTSAGPTFARAPSNAHSAQPRTTPSLPASAPHPPCTRHSIPRLSPLVLDGAPV